MCFIVLITLCDNFMKFFCVEAVQLPTFIEHSIRSFVPIFRKLDFEFNSIEIDNASLKQINCLSESLRRHDLAIP